ncbi:MAG TPA: hypothetical protein VG960_10515 [Caulobacteraceae bacterium]|nr:hypothetical protein [Caulobacteraceae bacterium]
MNRHRQWLLGLLVAASLAGPVAAFAADEPSAVINPPPTAKDWADMAKLPDWSGMWLPDVGDQIKQMTSNPTPWTDKAAAYIQHQMDDMKAGKPDNFFNDCLPEGMPSWMLISHNAMEVAFTPGRVYLFGESDSNRLRRIYTDGRPHPDDPDPTFHGHSIGHWEGDTLVIDTIGVVPQAWLAIGESVGIPNNGDMHIVERMKLAKPDELIDTLTITAPHVLTKPWTTTRHFTRERRRDFDMVEGICLEGEFNPAVDKDGNSIFVPQKFTTDGLRMPIKTP